MDDFKNLTAPVALSLDVLEPNTGQMKEQGLPENPKVIRDEKFELLKKNIVEHPEFLRQNSLIVYPYTSGKYLIIGGNQRYAALRDLGYKKVPCHILPKETPVENLKAFVVIDNTSFGQWDWQKLQQEDWNVGELKDWGVEVPFNWQKPESNFSGFEAPTPAPTPSYLSPGTSYTPPESDYINERPSTTPVSPTINNLPDELSDLDITPDELPKIVGEDKVAMERIIIVYPKDRVQDIINLTGLPKIEKVVYNLDEILPK